jgi:hypothetical protein
LPTGIADRLNSEAHNVDNACDVSMSATLHASCQKAARFWYPESYALPRLD